MSNLDPPPTMPPMTRMPPTASDSIAMAASRAYPLVDARCTHRGCDDQNAYRMTGHCGNCGASPLLVLISARHRKPTGATCPKCGCTTVTCDRLAEDDELPAPEGSPS